jgi:hypothetical protein
MSDRRQLTDGSPVPADGSHTEINPVTGMQRGYVVLSAEERAKGFVKPVRRSYIHKVPAVPVNLRDLTAEERTRYASYGYEKFEPYDGHPLAGRFWTAADLERSRRGCGVVTTMGTALAETYAREPRFYTGTFCTGCRAHYPLAEFAWEFDGEPMDPALQDAWHAAREVSKEHRAVAAIGAAAPEVLRRIAERGLAAAQAEGHSRFCDLFQHLLDEIARL